MSPQKPAFHPLRAEHRTYSVAFVCVHLPHEAPSLCLSQSHPSVQQSTKIARSCLPPKPDEPPRSDPPR
jgi:hypothetical protein